VNFPLARAFSYSSSVYSIIPFYGTTVIFIKPGSKSQFQLRHDFSLEDLDKLLDFAKSSGKVQFVLSARPIYYEKLDFLDPLFTELKVPEHIMLPADFFADKKTIDKSVDEFRTIARLGFENAIKNWVTRALLMPKFEIISANTLRFKFALAIPVV
jgi:hypothetical protein